MKNELTEIPLMVHSPTLYGPVGFALHKKLDQIDFLNRQKRQGEVGESEPGMFA